MKMALSTPPCHDIQKLHARCGKDLSFNTAGRELVKSYVHVRGRPAGPITAAVVLAVQVAGRRTQQAASSK
jgi:hypothetical protein